MGRSPFPLLDMTTTVTGLFCWRVFHPQERQLASLHLLLHRKGLSPSTPCRFIRTRRILIFACGTSSNRCAAGSVAMVEDEVEARSTSDASTATTYRRNAAALMLIRCLEIRYLGPHELAARLFLSGFPSQWSAAYRPASEVSTNTSGSGRGRWVICS